MCSPGQGKMGPLAPFPYGWLVPGRAVSWTSSFPKVLLALSLLPWLSDHLIEACVAVNNMEGSRSWTPKTRGVVQRSAALVYLFQACLAAEEQSYGQE